MTSYVTLYNRLKYTCNNNKQTIIFQYILILIVSANNYTDNKNVQ
jgi:hypothetical protein